MGNHADAVGELWLAENVDGQWASDAIRWIKKARWLPHSLKPKPVDHRA
jgi:hypothetical protein